MNTGIQTCIRTGIVIFVLQFLSGCGGVYVVDSIYKTQQLPEDCTKTDQTQCTTMYVSGKQMINNESVAFKTAFTDAHKTETDRNRLLVRIRLLSDEICKNHQGDIRGTATALNLTFGTMTTLFSGAAALSAGTAARTLAASASASNASRSLVNEEVYRQAFSDSIIRAIDADRKLRRQLIESGMKLKVAEYSIEQGILDIQEYHDRCSFLNGVTLLSQAIEKRGVVSKEDIIVRLDAMRNEMKKTDETIKILTNDETGKAALRTVNTKLMEEIGRLQNQLATAPQ